MAKRWLFLTFLLSFSTLATERKSIALIEIPGVLEAQNTNTPYGKLKPILFDNTKFKIDFTYVPSARAYKMLQENKADCIFPVVPNSANTQQTDTIVSDAINAIGAYLFTLKDSTLPLSINELNNKVIVFRRGYAFGNILSRYPNITLLPVDSQRAAVGMLVKKRADLFLDYLPDLRFVFKAETLNSLRFDLEQPVLFDADRVLCKKNNTNLAFIEQINQTITSLRTTHRLKDILGLYFLPVNKLKEPSQ